MPQERPAGGSARRVDVVAGGGADRAGDVPGDRVDRLDLAPVSLGGPGVQQHPVGGQRRGLRPRRARASRPGARRSRRAHAGSSPLVTGRPCAVHARRPAVEDADVGVAEVAQHPPGAGGGARVRVVVDDDGPGAGHARGAASPPRTTRRRAAGGGLAVPAGRPGRRRGRRRPRRGCAPRGRSRSRAARRAASARRARSTVGQAASSEGVISGLIGCLPPVEGRTARRGQRAVAADERRLDRFGDRGDDGADRCRARRRRRRSGPAIRGAPAARTSPTRPPPPGRPPRPLRGQHLAPGVEHVLGGARHGVDVPGPGLAAQQGDARRAARDRRRSRSCSVTSTMPWSAVTYSAEPGGSVSASRWASRRRSASWPRHVVGSHPVPVALAVQLAVVDGDVGARAGQRAASGRVDPLLAASAPT